MSTELQFNISYIISDEAWICDYFELPQDTLQWLAFLKQQRTFWYAQ
jgi:hypothetical protein